MATRDRRSGLAAMLTVVIGAAAAVAAHAADRYRAQVTFPPDKEPALYLEFSGAELRAADSQEGLATAPALKAARKSFSGGGRNQAQQSYSFAEADMPVSLPGGEKVRASFDFTRTVHVGKQKPAAEEGNAYVSASFRLEKVDAQGVPWAFVSEQGIGPSAKEGAGEWPTFLVPTPVDVKLTLVAQVEGKKVRIGVRVESGDYRFDKLLRKGRPALATIEVTDRPGKLVHSQKGDLEKFGFT